MKKRQEYLSMNPWEPWYGESKQKWFVYLPDSTTKDGRIRKERKTKKEIEDVIISYWKKEAENPTISEVFTEWNDRRLRLNQIKESTHLRDHQTFNRHYKSFGNRRIKDISAYEIEEFLEEEIADKSLTSKAFSNLKGITKGFMKRAKKRGLITLNVSELFSEMDVSDANFKKCTRKILRKFFQRKKQTGLWNI